MDCRLFTHPEPLAASPRVRPVFLPLAGCPGRCIYCHQPLATGKEPEPLERAHAALENDLERAARDGGEPFELAFYGGTFTALPQDWPERFLALAARYRSPGPVAAVRCSTRPDKVDRRMLAGLKSMGLDKVELGVQSFQDHVLERSGRGYAGAEAREACQAVREAGLGLGVQLMPGLPGMGQGDFDRDVEEACAQEPSVARLYPCLVLEGTVLAELWRRGGYRPLGLAQTIDALALALSRLWSRSIQVIRMGLAPEPGLEAGVLAGPAHPALGQMARSRALYNLVRAHGAALGRQAVGLRYPARYQGELLGHKGELAGDYARLGLASGSMRPWNLAWFCLF